jgi:hypothetical protein
MAIKKLIAFFIKTLILMSVLGCTIGNQSTGEKSSGSNLLVSNINKDTADPVGLGDDGYGNYFASRGNAFTPVGNPLFNIRNSSDPAICVYRHPFTKKDVLMMVTSCDMSDVDIPYVTPSGNNNYFPMNETYLYTTTDYDQNFGGRWYDHGAIVQENDFEWALKDAYNLWAPDLQYYNNNFYLYVPAKDKTDGNTQRIGIAIAPAIPTADGKICSKFIPQKDYLKINGTPPYGGFAYDPGIAQMGTDFYMTYCDNEHPAGRLNIAKMTDMKNADYIGKIKFKYNDPGDLYMEGPDICAINMGNHGGGFTMCYLQFAAKLPGKTERIGYATALLQDFKADPAGCWNFRGWIFQKVKDQDDNDNYWTNHADMCEYNGRYYIFYHKIVKDPADYPRSRNRQACVEQITFADNGDIMFENEDGNRQHVPMPGTSNGPFVKRLRCDLSGNYLTCTGTTDNPITSCQSRNTEWASQQWTIEDAGNGNKRLKNNWSGRDLTCTGTSDFNEVACENRNNYWDSQKWTIEDTGNGNKRLKNIWSGNYLTCTGNFEGSNVACQPLHKDESGNPDWSSQQWISEGNRLKNVWSGRDLTCTGNTDGASVRAQPLNESWTCQGWLPEAITPGSGTIRYRNLWSGKYLAVCQAIMMERESFARILIPMRQASNGDGAAVTGAETQL